MAGGWSRDGAVQDQIDASVEDAVKKARTHLPQGPSLRECEECGEEIAEARRLALPGVKLCLPCQQTLEDEQSEDATMNRRASKDSLLR